MNPKQDTNTSQKVPILGCAIFIHFTFLILLLGTASATTLPTTRSFDSKNNLLAETDPLGHISRYTYDAEKRPLSISDALNHATAITYSSIGNLTKMVDPSGTATHH